MPHIDDDNLSQRCHRCGSQIMCESPDNFDPVCYDDEDNVHGDCCCRCGDEQEREENNA